jgi:butyryl-CoA dehydrogenase
MNIQLTDEQRQVQDLCREFAAKELTPNARRWDAEHTFPREAVNKLGEMGLLGVAVPAEWGGAGMDNVCYAVAMEEISRGCAGTGVIMSVNNSLYCDPVMKFGTEAQKKEFLVPFAKGEKLGAFALTEPMSGSDAAEMRTVAVKKGDQYLLDGTKNFITNGPQADAILVFAMTDRAKRHKGISAFVVPADAKGFSRGKPDEKVGIRASGSCSIFFEGCAIPAKNRIGEEGDGFKVAMSTLDGGRIGIAAQALGISVGAYEMSVAYARERKSFGVPIGQHQMVQWMLADMATSIEAGRLLIQRAAALKDAGQPYATAAAMAKLFCAESAMKIATDAVQVHGGYGFIKEYQVERYFRDAKITQIYEGTSQIQKLVIARHLLSE